MLHFDSREPRSDYWISWQDVDCFKDEVKARADVEDPNSSTMHCIERWRNAGSEEQRKMFKVFDESGIFIACCHHRFMLVACDMVQSGELAKYPLAVIDHLLTVYGSNGGLAYDIGCAFATTLANSVLGPQAHALNLSLMVGAFHGHAHNRQCQLKWHPMYIPGTGHTEGEGCEHVFSASNALARAIEEHFAFWDADKYAVLSSFLRNHYHEVLKAVQTLEAELLVIQNELNLTDNDFRQFHKAEKKYFVELKELPHEKRLKIWYVEMLDELVENEWEEACATTNNICSHVAQDQIFLTIFCGRKHIDTAYAKLQNAETQASHMELELQIEEHWAISTLQRRSAAIQTTITRYNTQAQALDPPQLKISWKDITDYSFLSKFDLLRYSREDMRSNNWTKPAYHEATTKFFKLQRAREEIL
ncbi:hypothetical protein JVU11DRAFT_9839 [Chiua virens]|nr:hypothetical protein JVU11DRAFT_9839 [Chiua virens]